MKKHQTKLLSLVILCGIVSACQPKEAKNMIQRELNSGWTYHQANGDISGKAKVPGTIHTDLLANQQIEDPFYRVNEKNQQWIDKEDWEYSTVITLSKEELSKENLILDFQGLDTYADVYFNDVLILQADNMFREWETDIKQLAKEGENQLRIYFHSPIKKGLELLEASEYAYPAVNDQSENGGIGDKKVSIFTRKAGYHYGWDWSPRFVTSGIWRPIELKAWDDIRILDVFIRQKNVTVEQAELVAEFNMQADHDFPAKILLSDANTGRNLIIRKTDLKKGENQILEPFNIEKPKLWWSSGLGEPNLYEFEIKVIKDDIIAAKAELTTGLRSIKLVREKDDVGESFVFELNGVKVFAKGANYIPNDSFLPRVSKEDYEKVIADAKNANMNLLRVWGGGI